MPRYSIGVDVGGTKIQAGLVSTNNTVVSRRHLPLNKHNRKTVLQSIFTAIEPLCSKQVRAIGLGITGLIDVKRGVAKSSPHLPKNWHHVPLQRLVEKKFKKPVCLENDAHCVALAEAVVGVGKGYSIVLGLTIGTGIGAGLVINKKIYRGAHNVVEFGHTIISGELIRCHCGGWGHFEALVSGPAMTRRYQELTRKVKSPKEIEEEARAGQRPARQVIREMSDFLARGLANALHAYNPDILVLGGGVSRVDVLIRPAMATLKKYLLFPDLRKTKVVASRLKYDAGVIGAALLTKGDYV